MAGGTLQLAANLDQASPADRTRRPTTLRVLSLIWGKLVRANLVCHRIAPFALID
jgi:hypothetical protein